MPTRSRASLTVLGFFVLALGLPPSRALGDHRIPAGATLNIRTLQTLDPDSAWPGMRVEAVVDDPIALGKRILLPRGAPARLEVVYVTPLSNMEGPDRIILRVLSIEGGDRVYPVATNEVLFQGPSETHLRVPAETRMQFHLNTSVNV